MIVSRFFLSFFNFYTHKKKGGFLFGGLDNGRNLKRRTPANGNSLRILTRLVYEFNIFRKK